MNVEELPRWETSDLHPSLTSRSFGDALERLDADVTRAIALFDELDIRHCAARQVTTADGDAAERAIAAWNDTDDQARLLFGCVTATVATNSYDEPAQATRSRLMSIIARRQPLLARLADWVGALGVEPLAGVSMIVAEHRGPLRRLAQRSAHQMSEADEQLYAELRQTGSAAWQQLHSDLTSQLAVMVELRGGSRTVAMSELRGMSCHPDPAVRQAAYHAELAAWPTVATACAAAINAVKGESLAVNRRRQWNDPVDASLFANSVRRDTFEAMQDAVTRALADLRGWMRHKAALLGHPGGLPWWELEAPLPGERTTAEDAGHDTGLDAGLGWNQGIGDVRQAFAGYSPELAGLVDRAVEHRWIDVGPRPGKVGGAFCQSVVGDRSLILLNWNGTPDGVQTAAHELGHAYHNTKLAGRTALQRMLPMALAETASIFCETLMVEHGLQQLPGRQRLALLDIDLIGTTQLIVDIRSRYLFEAALFDRRRHSTLGVEQLNGLMLAAQQEAYADGLEQSSAHRYMWAVKGHYYSSAFYNWPYTFGLLFGIGLFAHYRNDPEHFREAYDEALSRVGMDQAEDIGAAFGFDLTDVAFWDASLDVVRRRIADYMRLSSR